MPEMHWAPRASVKRVVRATGRSEAEARAALAAMNARGALVPPADVAATCVGLLGDTTRTGAVVVVE